MRKLKYIKVKNVKSPTRNYKTDAGLDLYLPEKYEWLPKKGEYKIPLGIAIKLPKGYMAQVIERSSIANKGFIYAKSPIDSGYTGEIHLIVNKPIKFIRTFLPGDKVAQLVITKIKTPKIKNVYKFKDKKNKRNKFGFGSSGSR